MDIGCGYQTDRLRISGGNEEKSIGSPEICVFNKLSRPFC